MEDDLNMIIYFFNQNPMCTILKETLIEFDRGNVTGVV